MKNEPNKGDTNVGYRGGVLLIYLDISVLDAAATAAADASETRKCSNGWADTNTVTRSYSCLFT